VVVVAVVWTGMVKGLVRVIALQQGKEEEEEEGGGENHHPLRLFRTVR
jgi:hypothetical protein